MRLFINYPYVKFNSVLGQCIRVCTSREIYLYLLLIFITDHLHLFPSQAWCITLRLWDCFSVPLTHFHWSPKSLNISIHYCIKFLSIYELIIVNFLTQIQLIFSFLDSFYSIRWIFRSIIFLSTWHFHIYSPIVCLSSQFRSYYNQCRYFFHGSFYCYAAVRYLYLYQTFDTFPPRCFSCSFPNAKGNQYLLTLILRTDTLSLCFPHCTSPLDSYKRNLRYFCTVCTKKLSLPIF